MVLDEPTASLSAAEVRSLHAIVRRPCCLGRTVILVSHFLAEVLSLADTVTILRDGRVVRTGPAAAETEDKPDRGDARPLAGPDLPARSSCRPTTLRPCSPSESLVPSA